MVSRYDPSFFVTTPGGRGTAGWLRLVLLMMLSVPAIGFGQGSSETHIELSASEDQVYVQQQLLLTVRLFYSDRIVRGELTDPEHPDVIVEQLGQQRQYREDRQGQSYRVVERRFAIFPQKPGTLRVPDIQFQGTARHPSGRVVQLTDSASLFDIDVKDIPASFSGSHWLPAATVELSDRGITDGQEVQAGDTLTRSVTLSAEGVPGSTLPPLQHRYPDALRSYPEPASRQSSQGADSVSGRLEQTVALVPIPGNHGEVTLPELRVPWWDVEEDRERVAVLPSRTVRLAGLGPDRNNEAPVEQSVAEVEQQSERPAASEDQNTWPWLALIVLLATGWAATAIAWWLRARRTRTATDSAGADRQQADSERGQFRQLRSQALAQDPLFFSHFPQWATRLTGKRCLTTRDGLALLDHEELTRIVASWQQQLYTPQSNSTSSPLNANALAQALDGVRKEWLERHRERAHKQPLPNLYPRGIEP